jgi:hypothetical protein
MPQQGEGTAVQDTSAATASGTKAEDDLSISLLALANGVDEADTPAFVKARLSAEPRHLTLAEFKSLGTSEQQAVLSTVKKAIENYRARAERSARGTSQPGRTADDLQAFADAASAQ